MKHADLSRRAHPVPRRPAQFPGARPAAHRRECRGGACARDIELELEALTQLRGAIAHCEKVKDYVSRDLFSEILDNEEEHVDTLEQQFEMIARMGIQNYIQLQ